MERSGRISERREAGDPNPLPPERLAELARTPLHNIPVFNPH
jgi:hypothetical protein